MLIKRRLWYINIIYEVESILKNGVIKRGCLEAITHCYSKYELINYKISFLF